MSLEGCERVNFMRGEVARAISTCGPNFEGEAKVIRRGCLVHMFESDQSQYLRKTSKARIGNDLRS